MPTQISINMGTHNTYIAVKEEGGRNTPKFIKKIKTEVMIPLKLDPLNMTPRTKISGFNRLIGRKFDDPIVQKQMEIVPYMIVRKGNKACVQDSSSGVIYYPTQLLEKFLSTVKKTAESHLGYVVSHIVLVFPSKVSCEQLDHIVAAARKVRLVHGSFINEFTAAVCAYGFLNKDGVSAVVDLGGKSMDVSLFQVTYTHRGTDFKLIGKETKTDMFLGGDDFDYVIAQFLVNEFKNTEGIDLTTHISIIESLREVAEKAKVELSSLTETEINVPIFTIDESGGTKGLKVTLTRSMFEDLATCLIEKIRNQCVSHMKEAGVVAANVDDVILVGGMARVAMVKRVVTEVFGKSPARGVNPDEAVALGAAAAVEAGCLGLHPSSLDVQSFLRSSTFLGADN